MSQNQPEENQTHVAGNILIGYSALAEFPPLRRLLLQGTLLEMSGNCAVGTQHVAPLCEQELRELVTMAFLASNDK